MFGTPRPPLFLFLCSLPIFILTFLRCHRNCVNNLFKLLKKLLGIVFGSICSGYNSLGKIFILSTLILPNQDTGKVPHLCKSSLMRIVTGVRLSLINFLREGPILIPRYVISLGDQWKGKPLGGEEPARAPTGMASVLVKFTLKPDICPNCCRQSSRLGIVVSMSTRYKSTSSYHFYHVLPLIKNP